MKNLRLTVDLQVDGVETLDALLESLPSWAQAIAHCAVEMSAHDAAELVYGESCLEEVDDFRPAGIRNTDSEGGER